MKQKQGVLIKDLHAAFVYGNRLGLAGGRKETMHNKQANLKHYADQMLAASGQYSWESGFKPFRVKFNRHERTFMNFVP